MIAWQKKVGGRPIHFGGICIGKAKKPVPRAEVLKWLVVVAILVVGSVAALAVALAAEVSCLSLCLLPLALLLAKDLIDLLPKLCHSKARRPVA